MSNVIVFKPRRELDAQANLDAFVAFARDELTTFGANLEFDNVVWDVTEVCSRKGQGKNHERITFSTLNSARDKHPVALSDAVRPFAQAYMRQLQALRPIVSLGQRLAALRGVEAALTENGAALSPVKVDANIMNRAAQVVKEHFSEGAAYRIGIQLEMIAKFMVNHGLTVVPLNWRNPIKRPTSSVRVGERFDKRRAEKMPSESALEALPHIFRNATEARDVLVSSISAILCSAPDRISEVLLLPNDCETTGPSEGDGAYGLRWWPAKGADPMVKWIVPSMSGVVREALAKIRKLTEPARVIARWYEENSDCIFLPKEFEELRSHEMLSMAEVAKILWGEHGLAGSARDWCEQNDIHLQKSGTSRLVSFGEVEKAVLAMLPSTFPVLNATAGLVYSDALMVVQKNMFGLNRATYACVVEPVVVQHINDGLGSRSGHGRKSVFAAFEFTEPDGHPIKVTSHQFRHYLNTLAQAGGLSQLDIAKWSGRKDIRQNEAYDHVSANEMLVSIREAVGDVSRAIGPLATVPKHYLVRRDEFARLMIPTAHTTDFGYCVHDYTMAPCQVHLDCINCQEHICIKGDEQKMNRLRQQLDEAQGLLARAETASKEGYWGSDRWLEHHTLTTERLRQLCEIMGDPKVPVGAVIQLNNVKSASRIGQAALVRAQLSSAPENNEEFFEDLRSLLPSEGKLA